ncbi:MAG: hypothetical protein WBD95_17565 [Xanthobacteraceae bacterium]
MKKLVLIAVLLLATSPVAAQVATNGQQQSGATSDEQQVGGQNGQSAGSQAPTTGVICLAEMTATFCNVATSPNTNGYGSTGGSGSSSGSGSGGSAGGNTLSTLPCPYPSSNELCE